MSIIAIKLIHSAAERALKERGIKPITEGAGEEAADALFTLFDEIMEYFNEKREKRANREREEKEGRIDAKRRALPISTKEIEAVSSIMQNMEELREQGNQGYFHQLLTHSESDPHPNGLPNYCNHALVNDYLGLYRWMDAIVHDEKPDASISDKIGRLFKPHYRDEIFNPSGLNHLDYLGSVFNSTSYRDPQETIGEVIKPEADKHMGELAKALLRLVPAYKKREPDDLMDRFQRTVALVREIEKSPKVVEAAIAAEVAGAPNGQGHSGEPAIRANPEPNRETGVKA